MKMIEIPHLAFEDFGQEEIRQLPDGNISGHKVHVRIRKVFFPNLGYKPCWTRNIQSADPDFVFESTEFYSSEEHSLAPVGDKVSSEIIGAIWYESKSYYGGEKIMNFINGEKALNSEGLSSLWIIFITDVGRLLGQ